MPVAHQVDALHLARQVGMRGSQHAQHALRPVVPRPFEQRAPVRRIAAPGHVRGEHRRARMRPRALVHGVDVAEALRAVEDVVPRGRCAGRVVERLVELQVRHQPGGVTQLRRRRPQRRRRRLDQPRGDEQRRREHDVRRGPALDVLRAVVPPVDLHACRSSRTPARCDPCAAARRAAPPAASRAPRCFGPGEHRVALVVLRVGARKPCRLAK
jgi:hypothetical protein